MKNILILLQFLALWNTSAIAQQKDSVVTLPEVVVTSIVKISEQVEKSFADKFPDASDAVWKKLNKDYLTKFIQADVKHQALFRKNGTLRYDIIYMGESHVPKRIFDLINGSYDAYIITNAARVDHAGQIFWIVNLESARSYKVIRIDDNDELQEVKSFFKSNEG
jgi:hypothetical protein